MMRNGPMTRMAAGALLVLALGPVGPGVGPGIALGQDARMRSANGRPSEYQPDFDPADLAVFVEAIGLDAEQQAAVRSGIEAYGAWFQAAARALRERVTGVRVTLRSADDDAASALLRAQAARSAIMAEWMADREQRRTDFLEGVRVLLTDAQDARWPALERRLRRSKHLPRGRLSGESLDLFAVVGTVTGASADDGASWPPGVSGLLEAYEIELDAVLRARAAVPELTVAGAPTRDPAYDAARAIGARTAVRDVNLAYADRIVAAFGPARERAVRDRVNRMAFPLVYRRTNAQSRLAAAITLTGAETGAPDPNVVALESEYTARLAELRGQLREIVRRHEPEQHRRRHRQAHLALEDPDRDVERSDDPIRAGFERLRALDREVLVRLRELLTTEQADAILGKARQARGGAGADSERKAPTHTTIEQQAWVMDAFDADRNGYLDEGELEALREYLRTPRERR